MLRTHRSIARRARKIDVEAVANRAEDYLAAFKRYKLELPTGIGLIGDSRVKSLIKRIDDLEKESFRLEEKIERLIEKRSLLAVELEHSLDDNMKILGEYLEMDEIGEF